jgi:hypothetical protein
VNNLYNNITPKQASFIATLIRERGIAVEQIPGEFSTKVGASAVITWLLRQPKVSAKPAPAPAVEAAAQTVAAIAPSEPAKLEVGVYEFNGEIYVVKPNREKTRLYAKKLVEIGGRRLTESNEIVNIEFEYAPGVIYSLLPSHKMSIERARELTLRYGRCIVCGRRLKDATSVDKGIGPVCRKSFSAAA